MATFTDELQALGYLGQANIRIEGRFAEGQYERLPALAAELIRLTPDVLVVEGGPAARAAKAATSTVPIVMTFVADPVGVGLVASLGRPGGNVTGLSDLQAGLTAKRLELLKEAVPSATRVALLSNPQNKQHEHAIRTARTAAHSLRVTLQEFEAGRPEEIERAFTAIRREQSESLLVLGDALFGVQRENILELAAKNRLPGLYQDRRWAEAGGLMSYGANYEDLFRRAAVYASKILKGAKPADLPVEQPTKFELVVNLKTAKALGLTIPRSVLLRADRVIE